MLRQFLGRTNSAEKRLIKAVSLSFPIGTDCSYIAFLFPLTHCGLFVKSSRKAWSLAEFIIIGIILAGGPTSREIESFNVIASCISARRRSRVGLRPHYGTGWLTGKSATEAALRYQSWWLITLTSVAEESGVGNLKQYFLKVGGI
ncbi:resistance to Congo red protein, partial [Aspergillus lucknowensis]